MNFKDKNIETIDEIEIADATENLVLRWKLFACTFKN